MMNPTLPGWKVETIGDDIAWMKFRQDENGRKRLFAINPEAGFFGVAPGTNYETNRNAMESLKENSIFTNVARTDDGDVWWEDIDGPVPDHLIDWRGNDWTPDSDVKAAHPNARFTAPAAQCPVIAPNWEDPNGVPIDAILFGGRRQNVIPLVTEATDWTHGTFLGSVMSSAKTAAASGQVGVVRRDPMAMLPFCGYHMGDYFNHWLSMGEQGGATVGDWGGMPRIFYVNWFRRDDQGKFLWPGFGENSRVLKWVVERCAGRADAIATPIGLLPAEGALDTTGLDLSAEEMTELFRIDIPGWKDEIASMREHYAQFGDKLPAALAKQLDALEARLNQVG